MCIDCLRTIAETGADPDGEPVPPGAVALIRMAATSPGGLEGLVAEAEARADAGLAGRERAIIRPGELGFLHDGAGPLKRGFRDFSPADFTPADFTPFERALLFLGQDPEAVMTDPERAARESGVDPETIATILRADEEVMRDRRLGVN